MSRKTRRALAVTEIAAGCGSWLALLALLGTVGGMEQGSIDLDDGCIRAAVLLAVMGIGVLVSQIQSRPLRKRSKSGHGGENRA